MIGLSLRRWLRAAGAVLLLAALLPLYGGVAHATSNTQSAKALSDHKCDTSEWHFVITQVASEEQAPSAIQVSWENGDSQPVRLDKYTGKTAHYSTTSNLDSTVTSATAALYDGWDGQFNLSHGPCNDPTPEQCPAGEEMGDDGKCEPEEQECPAGQHMGDDGKCEPKEQECPAGQHMGDDDECVGNGGGHTPVNVCHGTGSGYVFITVDADSADFQGHLMHRTEPVEPRNRDYVGSYTDADGVFHELDGDIDGIEDCPPDEEEPVAPTGGFTTECTAAGALVDLATLSTGSASGTFQLVVNGAAQTVASGQQDIAVPGGANLVLKLVPTSGEPTTMQSGTAPAACQPPVVAPSGSFAASCTATGALVDIGTLTEGTSSGGTFQLVVNGVAQTVTSGQQDVVVPGGASLVLQYKPASDAVATLATSMAPAACPATTTPGGGGTTGGATGGTEGETEVEGTKTGNAGSRTPTVGSDTGVQGVKTGSSGVLAATGSAVPAGSMVSLAGMMVLMGAALLRVAVGGRRS